MLNYNVYQDNLNNRKTTEEQQKNINNNDNNDNNTICMYSENLKEIVSLLEQNIGIIPIFLSKKIKK